MTDKEIAAFFEVSEQRLNNWKTVHPECFESMRLGKDKSDADVALKLRNRATGAEGAEDQQRRRHRLLDFGFRLSLRLEHRSPAGAASNL